MRLVLVTHLTGLLTGFYDRTPVLLETGTNRVGNAQLPDGRFPLRMEHPANYIAGKWPKYGAAQI
jgi:hypothetical protein